MRGYLEALEAHKPKRGRKRTPESMKSRITRIEADLGSADPLKRLLLTQERLDIERELSVAEEKVDLSALEKEFVAAAAPYGERKRISYAAWRALGVTPAVLKKAGIRRGQA